MILLLNKLPINDLSFYQSGYYTNLLKNGNICEFTPISNLLVIVYLRLAVIIQLLKLKQKNEIEEKMEHQNETDD